jgi:uncharacterized protein (DUF433 family)
MREAKGTRAIELWSEPEILQNYPRLAHEDIQACLSYGSYLMKSERAFPEKVLQ